jgi:hypothetical protein
LITCSNPSEQIGPHLNPYTTILVLPHLDSSCTCCWLIITTYSHSNPCSICRHCHRVSSLITYSNPSEQIGPHLNPCTTILVLPHLDSSCICCWLIMHIHSHSNPCSICRHCHRVSSLITYSNPSEQIGPHLNPCTTILVLPHLDSSCICCCCYIIINHPHSNPCPICRYCHRPSSVIICSNPCEQIGPHLNPYTTILVFPHFDSSCICCWLIIQIHSHSNPGSISRHCHRVSSIVICSNPSEYLPYTLKCRQRRVGKRYNSRS